MTIKNSIDLKKNNKNIQTFEIVLEITLNEKNRMLKIKVNFFFILNYKEH